MKKLFLLIAMFCTSPVWADFCSENKGVQIGKQVLSVVSQDNAYIKSADCRGDTLDLHIAIGLPDENITRQMIIFALQQFDFKNALCSTAEVKKFATHGLNRIVYTYSETNGTLISRKEILLNQCQ